MTAAGRPALSRLGNVFTARIPVHSRQPSCIRDEASVIHGPLRRSDAGCGAVARDGQSRLVAGPSWPHDPYQQTRNRKRITIRPVRRWDQELPCSSFVGDEPRPAPSDIGTEVE
jgi:hypothetical protein